MQAVFRRKKVLVIDDCAPVRATVKGMLQQMGFEAEVSQKVQTITYARHAAQVLRQNKLEKAEQERFEKYLTALKQTQPGLAQVQL